MWSRVNHSQVDFEGDNVSLIERMGIYKSSRHTLKLWLPYRLSKVSNMSTIQESPSRSANKTPSPTSNVRSRRSHTKSRHGCLGCKQRRKKVITSIYHQLASILMEIVWWAKTSMFTMSRQRHPMWISSSKISCIEITYSRRHMESTPVSHHPNAILRPFNKRKSLNVRSLTGLVALSRTKPQLHYPPARNPPSIRRSRRRRAWTL